MQSDFTIFVILQDLCSLKGDKMDNVCNKFVDFFKSGIKSDKKKLIGIEIEHFIVHKDTNEAVSYYETNGVKTILSDLMKYYSDSTPIIDEDIIGFRTKEFNITLEPAAQFEISINPYEDIEKIENIYKDFLDNLNSILNKYSYKISFSSCQPQSHIDNIKIIPKKRYELMERYFKKINSNGIHMMKGTCSLQVSIDYFSEDDFRKKIQVAYFLTPFFKLISNNSHYYQGMHFDSFLKRTQIYNDTDHKRCGIPPNIFSENYGFKDYAEYLCTVPMIFYKKDNNYYETDKTFKELFNDKNIDNDVTLHMISIVFPDVRLKKYIEIRGADLIPIKYILGYCALIKGIFYSEENLDIFYNMIRKFEIDNNKIKEIEKNIIKFGWHDKIYGIPFEKFAEKIIELTKKNLNDKDSKYFESIMSIVKNKGLLNIENK